MNHKKTDCDNLEGCLKIFVSWQWGITIMGGFVVVLVVSAFSRGVEITNMKRDIQEVKTTISVIQKMDSKLDSLLKK